MWFKKTFEITNSQLLIIHVHFLSFSFYFRCMIVGIILGGVSPEHEISIKSAKNIFLAGTESKDNTFRLIGISKTGQWYLLPDSFIDSFEAIGSSKLHQPLLLIPGAKNPICLDNKEKEALPMDAIFPIVHGNNGEDGLLQGLLEILNIPFVGPGVLASSMCMDKEVTKQLLKQNGIPVTPGTSLYSYKIHDYDALILEFGLPLFVKPANAGSAVGVGKAESLNELKLKVEEAFAFDDKVLVEKAMTGREVEVAVLGNRVLEVSTVGEIIVHSEFYTYENKYSNPDTIVNVPAKNFNKHEAEELSAIALKAYEIMQLEGMSRVDFFYSGPGEYCLNEINTLPGFTDISMYPMLMKTEGYSFTQLVDRLCDLAQERHNYRSRKQRSL